MKSVKNAAEGIRESAVKISIKVVKVAPDDTVMSLKDGRKSLQGSTEEEEDI